MKSDGNLPIKKGLRNTQSLLMDKEDLDLDIQTRWKKQLWAVISKKTRYLSVQNSY